MNLVTHVLKRFHRPEHGSALTEFTLFLPIWVMMFVAITSLARIGVFSTTVQLQAQKELWSKTIPLTNSAFDVDTYSTPIGGYADAAANYGRVAGLDGNPQSANDGVESAANVTWQVRRHYLESYSSSVLPPTLGFHADNINASSDPTDVLDMEDTERYPHKLLNDTIEGTSFDGGLIAAVGALAQVAGFVHYSAAGIQYGSVFADKQDSTPLMGNWGELTAGFHIDTLVPPRPLKDTEADTMPATWAFLMFKGDEKYGEYLQWGNENWGGGSGDGAEHGYTGSTDPDDIQEQNQDEIDQASGDCQDAADADAAQQQADYEAAGGEGQNPNIEPFDYTTCGD